MENSHTEQYKEQRAEIKALADAILEIESIDSSRAFAEADRRVRRSQRQQRFNTLMRYAALLILPLMFTSVLFGYLYFAGQERLDEYASVTALPGTVVRYELPDKSVAWLNSGSTLRYSARFKSDRREVELSGEAYFEVTADKKHPFYVNTPSGVTTYVYGTKFNVLAYDDVSFTEVVLEQGRVNVLIPGYSAITVKPGEQVFYDKLTGKYAKSETNVKDKKAWKEGRLVFRDASLDYILFRLEKRFNVEINYLNPKNQDVRLRATFSDESLPQILDYLSQSVPITWSYITPESAEDARKRIAVELKSR